MLITDLHANEYNPYYGRYISKLAADLPLREGFVHGKKNVTSFLSQVPEDKLLHRYAEDKWTIKEVFQHLIDTERIFAYRAFRIARNDTTHLADFDQNRYVVPSGANQKSRQALLDEFAAVRDASIALITSLSDDDLTCIGICSNHPMSARAAAFTILGHEIWHMEIISERYLG